MDNYTNIQKAINYFKCTRTHLAEVNIDGLVAHNLAIEALEKQLSKKPIQSQYTSIGGNYYDFCPCCDSIVETSMSYCEKCKQRLDWSL